MHDYFFYTADAIFKKLFMNFVLFYFFQRRIFALVHFYKVLQTSCLEVNCLVQRSILLDFV